MRIINLFISLLSVVSLISCNDIRKAYSTFCFQRIDIPELMAVDINGSCRVDSLSRDKMYLFILKDSTSCTSCSIKSMSSYRALYELAATRQDFDVITIVSPRGEDLNDVYHLSKRLLPPRMTIYVDYSNKMFILNKIPNSPAFRYFLVSQDRYPIFVGNPLQSNRLWDIFIRTLDSMPGQRN